MSKGKEGKWKSCIFQSLQHLCKPSLFCKGFQIQAWDCPGSRNNVFEVAGADFMFRLIRLIDLWDRAVEFWWNTSPDRFSSQLFFRQDKWTCDAEYEAFLAAVNSLHFWKSNKGKSLLRGKYTVCTGLTATLVGPNESYMRYVQCPAVDWEVDGSARRLTARRPPIMRRCKQNPISRGMARRRKKAGTRNMRERPFFFIKGEISEVRWR